MQKEQKLFNEITRASNEEELQLNEVIEDDNSDEWCGPKPWSPFFHWELEEDDLITCRNINDWENREGIDGHNSISRPKTFFELASNR